MEFLIIILISCLILAIFLISFFVFKKFYFDRQSDVVKEQAKYILDKASSEAEILKSRALVEAKEKSQKFRESIEEEMHDRLKDIQFREKRLINRENEIEEKSRYVENLQKKSKSRMNEIDRRLSELKELQEAQMKKLQKVSGMSLQKAKEELLKMLENQLTHEKSSAILRFEENLKNEEEKIAKEIISDAIQRYSSDFVSMNTVSVVDIPNDSIKSYIIGREGRNIRALEALTGVDLIIDDSPEVITISSFDPYRREIAKVAIELLIIDGRIQPSKIEEMVHRATKEVDKGIKIEGQRVVLDLQIRNIHKELINLIGKLKFRNSYGQNVLKHSIEVSCISSMLASELGADAELAKRCGLLHDIGKALSYKVEGSHVDIGVDVLKKYGESDLVINSVASHHGDCKPESVEAILVQAADSISASRPGARKENFENYVKRIHDLEQLVSSFEFVEKCYAIQAGREVRIIVSPLKISDDEMVTATREISKKIEENLEYPGQIKISMIRENRVVDYAR